MKIIAFWDIAACSFHHYGDYHPDGGGGLHLWNISVLKRNYHGAIDQKAIFRFSVHHHIQTSYSGPSPSILYSVHQEYCPHHHRPDDGGSAHLWNIGQLQRCYIPEHTKLHTSRSENLKSHKPKEDCKGFTQRDSHLTSVWTKKQLCMLTIKCSENSWIRMMCPHEIH